MFCFWSRFMNALVILPYTEPGWKSINPVHVPCTYCRLRAYVIIYSIVSAILKFIYITSTQRWTPKSSHRQRDALAHYYLAHTNFLLLTRPLPARHHKKKYPPKCLWPIVVVQSAKSYQFHTCSKNLIQFAMLWIKPQLKNFKDPPWCIRKFKQKAIALLKDKTLMGKVGFPRIAQWLILLAFQLMKIWNMSAETPLCSHSRISHLVKDQLSLIQTPFNLF